MKLSKKAVIVIIISVLVVAIGATGIILALNGTGAGSGDGIYVQPISSILGYTSAGGMQNRYAGVVEAQETISIEKDENRTVSKVHIKEGDIVKKGDVLFEYDTDEADMAVEQAKLELERIKNSISAFNSQIAELEKERKKAPNSEKLQYTLQIQEAQASMKTEEYNAKVKQLELDKLDKNAVESEVKASMAGVIKTFNESGMDAQGNKSYITLMATGDYRIKGLVNEQNVRNLAEGDTVTIRSRVDSTQTWQGTIGKINTEQVETDQNNGGGGMMMAYGGGGDSDNTTQSTKYPFYVTLDSLEGLMMGQHVYIELGGAEADTEGLKLPSMFLVQGDGDPYVWADKNGKLQRRSVVLGTYDELTDSYLVESGLTLDDKLAFPDATLKEGNKTVEELPVESMPDGEMGDPNGGAMGDPAAGGADEPAEPAGGGDEPAAGGADVPADTPAGGGVIAQNDGGAVMEVE